MKRLTKKQAIIVSAYTGYLCCNFADMHKAIEQKLGRPVFTHELADIELYNKIRQAFKQDFLEISHED